MRNIIIKNKIPSIFSLLIVISIIGGISFTYLEADDINVLTRDTFIEDMMEYSTALESLEEARNDLALSLSSFSDSVSGLKVVYEQLETYRTLGSLYDLEAGQVNHIEFLNLQLLGGLSLDEPMRSRFINLRDNDAADVVMTGQQYGAYKQLQGMFQVFGIPNHQVSKETEYNTFVNTIYVTPLSMQQALLSLNRQLESLPNTLESGASELYNTIVMMEDVLKLLDNSYRSSEQDYKRSLQKYEKGLMSEYDFNIIDNNQKIAKVNRDTMERNIDNLKMQLNVMRGVSPNVEFDVEQFKSTPIALDDLDLYIEKALLNSNDIKDKEDAVYYQQVKFDYIAEYFSKSSDEYKMEKLQLDLYKLELQETITDTEVSVINKYSDVVLNKAEYNFALKDVEEANKQMATMSANVEAGFVAEYVLSDFNILVIQKINTENTELRDYTKSLETLYSFCGLELEYMEGENDNE